MASRTGSLYWKTARNIAYLFLVVGIGYVLILFKIGSKVSDQQTQVLLWELSNRIAVSLDEFFAGDASFWDAEKVIEDFRLTNPLIDVYLLDHEGKVVLDFSLTGARFHNTIPLGPIKQFISEGHHSAPLYATNPTERSGKVIFSAAKVRYGSEDGYLYVVLASRVLNRAYGEIAGVTVPEVILFSVMLSIAGALLTGIGVYQVLSRRMFKIDAVVTEFESGNFVPRVADPQDDELGRLGRTIDQMADTIASQLGELQKRDGLRRQLIADVSHDLRRPVTVISAYVEKLHDHATSLTGEIADYVRIAQRNIANLAQMLNELFELAKLEALEAQPSFEVIELSGLVEDATSFFHPQAVEKGVALESVLSDMQIFVQCDCMMISRVLGNLVENAIRYTPSGGRVWISALPVSGSLVKIEVSDSGVGIPESEKSQLFDRFVQGAPVQDAGHGMSGLGLAIVKKIVEAHGSQITVQSTQGKGTTFTFFIKQAVEQKGENLTPA